MVHVVGSARVVDDVARFRAECQQNRNAARSSVLGLECAEVPRLQTLAPSTSLWVTRIVRGQPWAAERRTQYVSPSKEIHDTVGIDPSGPATANGLDRLRGLTR